MLSIQHVLVSFITAKIVVKTLSRMMLNTIFTRTFTRISAAPPPSPPPLRCLFEYFLKMIQIHCNRCNAVLSQQWELIFINSDVFQFKVSISRRSLIQFSLQNLRVRQFLRESCKLRRYDKPNLPLSLPCNCYSKEIVSVC